MVRPARVGDLASVVRLEREAETAPHWAEAVYAGMLAEGADAGREHRVLVAELAGQAVGFGVASLVTGGAAAEVENLVTAKGERRRGVGRAICEAMMKWARERGAVEMELEVRAGNVGARVLYGRLGFLEFGLRRAYYDGVEDAVLMRVLLVGSDQ